MMFMTREPDDTSVNFESPTQRLTQSCQTVCVRYKHPLTLISNNKDKVYQLLAHGRKSSPVIHASFTTKTGHRDIPEIVLTVVSNTKKQ
jgi:hypothetical protein